MITERKGRINGGRGGIPSNMSYFIGIRARYFTQLNFSNPYFGNIPDRMVTKKESTKKDEEEFPRVWLFYWARYL